MGQAMEKLKKQEVFWQDFTCLQEADCLFELPGTLGINVAAPFHVLWTDLGEVAPSEKSISQQSGRSCSLMPWKSCFQFPEGGVTMLVRYSLFKNCHITNR